MSDSRSTVDKRPTRDRLTTAQTVIAIVATSVAAIYGTIQIVQSGFFDQPSPTPTPEIRSIPNVYDMVSNQAVTALKSAGFTPRTIMVCSHSVGQGKVRQVVIDAGGSDEVVLVDMNGATPGLTFANGTAVLVKVSTGIPCP